MKINFLKIISKKRPTNYIELCLLFLTASFFYRQAFASDGNAMSALAEVVWYAFLLGEGILLLVVAGLVVLIRKLNNQALAQYFILGLAAIICGAEAFYWLKAGFSYTWPFALGMCFCLGLIVWLLTRKVKL